MKIVMHADFDKYRFDGSDIDMVKMFTDFTDLDMTIEEKEFVDMYLSSIQKIQRINSRQVTAMAITTAEALVCMGRATAAAIDLGDTREDTEAG